MSVYNGINPYNVMDGPWGGFGIQTWFSNIDPENPKNVFQSDRKYLKDEGVILSKYIRVWDNSKSIWRDLTDDEKILFTIPDEKIPIINGVFCVAPDITKNRPYYKS